MISYYHVCVGASYTYNGLCVISSSMQVIFSPAEVSSLRASWVGNGDSLDSDLAAAASSSSSSSTTGRQRRNSQRSAWGDLDDVGFGHNNYNHSNGASSAGAAAATAGGNSSSRSNNRNGGGSNGRQQQPGIVRNLGFGDHDIDGNHASADKDTGEAAAVAERFRQRSLQRQSSKLAESLPEGWAAELDPTTQVWFWGLIG